MKRRIMTALLIGLGLTTISCSKRSDDRGMGAGADTTGLRDTTQAAPAPAPVPGDTTKTP